MNSPSQSDPSDPRPQTPKPEPGAPEPAFEVVWKVEEGGPEGAWDPPARFQLLRDLGDGRLGPIFVVRDLERGGRLARLEVVAGALAPSEDDRRAIEEALDAVARLDSPHLARCTETARLPDGRVYALFEHAAGESLEHRLAREDALHPVHALEIARQVLRALETLHAGGLAHGDLSSRSVWLDHHVAKSDSNPFGVRALLRDAGVARPEGGAGVDLDLRRTGVVLADMLGETANGGMRRAAARALADKLRSQGASAFADAAQARIAVESLLAPSREDAAPAPVRLRFAALTTAAVACIALGWFAWRRHVDAATAAEAAADQRARFERAQGEALDRIDQLRAQLASGESVLNAQLDEIEAALLREDELRSGSERASAVALARLEVERGNVERLSRELERERGALAQVRSELAEALAASEMSVRAARGLDATLALVDAGEGERALQRARILEAEGLFGQRTDFVSALAAACEPLERFESSRAAADESLLDLGAVRSASAGLERARGLHPAFVAEASEWLELELADAPPGSRGERLERTLEMLEGRVRAAVAAGELAHERDWFAMRGEPALRSPERAVAHAARFACRHLDEVGEAFARELRERAVADGSIDVRQLDAAPGVEPWVELVRRGEVRLVEDLARDLELLDAARRWYSTGASPSTSLLDQFRSAPADLREGSSWRDQLDLQWRLARSDASLALEVGRSTWRLDVDPTGRLEWWRDSVEFEQGDVRRFRRARFSADGSAELGQALLSVERADARVRFVGSRQPLVDLRAWGASVAVSETPVADYVEPPSSLGVPQETLAKVREDSAGERCLVFTHGAVRRWVSPSLGIVREETRTPEGLAVTQLVAMLD